MEAGTWKRLLFSWIDRSPAARGIWSRGSCGFHSMMLALHSGAGFESKSLHELGQTSWHCNMRESESLAAETMAR